MPVFEDDPYGGIKEVGAKQTASPTEVNSFHQRSDVDSRPNAQHHTLGISANQATPGDHVHDGRTSRKLGHKQGLTISGSKGGNAAVGSIIALLSNFIEFTDNTT
jgi:hypothetical protein